MADRNIRIRNHNGTEWDNLHPETNSEMVKMSDNVDLQTSYDNLVSDVGSKLEESDLSGYATTQQLAEKANANDVYTKTQVDGLIDGVGSDGIHVGETEPVGDEFIWFQEL